MVPADEENLHEWSQIVLVVHNLWLHCWPQVLRFCCWWVPEPGPEGACSIDTTTHCAAMAELLLWEWRHGASQLVKAAASRDQ